MADCALNRSSLALWNDAHAASSDALGDLAYLAYRISGGDKNVSIAYTAKQIGMDKKLFKKTYPQSDYEQMEANEKQAVSNLLTAIYIYNGQRVDTKVAQGLQRQYGALTIRDYLDWKDNNTKSKWLIYRVFNECISVGVCKTFARSDFFY